MSYPNVVSSFVQTANRLTTADCFRYKKNGAWHALSWNEVKQAVFNLASALEFLGIKPQDKVAILSNTRYEWTIIDLAILAIGAVTVPIYQSSLPKDVEYILKHSDSKIVFVENRAQYQKVEAVQKELPHLSAIISIEKVTETNVLSYERLVEESEADTPHIKQSIQNLGIESLATLVYTSGTTGLPKGVMLSHKNLAAAIDSLDQALSLDETKESLFFLPLAHILAREVQFYQLAQGFVHIYAESIDKLIDNIKEVSPHFMVCVPRIFEKIYTKIMNDVEKSSSLKKTIFNWALSVGQTVSQSIQQQKSLSLALTLKKQIADRLVFSKLHQKLGGKMQFFVSGGAPLSKAIAEFFHAAGLLILEGYGLTETVAGINCNNPNQYRFGTVGQPLANIQEKIAEDGEILVKGDHVFQGYYKDPESTQQAFNSEGYFLTGDIGEFDAQNYLKITDRKKDLIITAAGKNIAPQYLENLLKTDPLISQVMVHGDKRKYLTALISLNPEQLTYLGTQLKLPEKDYASLAKNPKIYEIVKKRIDEKNKQLASFESIKRFEILEKDLTVEDGELTPSLKVKRKLLTERYKSTLDSMYQE